VVSSRVPGNGTTLVSRSRAGAGHSTVSSPSSPAPAAAFGSAGEADGGAAAADGGLEAAEGGAALVGAGSSRGSSTTDAGAAVGFSAVCSVSPVGRTVPSTPAATSWDTGLPHRCKTHRPYPAGLTQR
jgi:hypothetical protein